jgi:hypothetical protein
MRPARSRPITVLEHLEQAPVRPQLVRAELVEHPGGAAHVEGLLLGREHVGERRPKPLEERALALGELRILEARPQQPRAELEAGDGLVQILPGPLRQARVDRLVERAEPLRHAARGRDDDDHDDVRLQQEHLDVPHARRLERRRGHERQQVREVGERLRRRPQGRVDLALDTRQVEVEAHGTRLQPVEQAVDEEAVPGFRRHPPGRRVRVREQPLLLEHRQFVADRRGGHFERRPLDERLRADGKPRRDVLLDHARQDQLLAGGQA